MSSVLKPWVMEMGWKMQSILLSGLRAPDFPTVATKKICRWMRAECQNNADPSKGYMEPQALSDKLVDDCMEELEYLPCHYVHHFADALAVVAYHHPDEKACGFALSVHDLVAEEIFHFRPETREQFMKRHVDKTEHTNVGSTSGMGSAPGVGYMADGYEDELNWNDGGSLVPQGNYYGEIIKAEYRPTVNGKHMAKVQLKIETAYNHANKEKSVGCLVFDNFIFTQDGSRRIKNFAEAAGIELPSTINQEIVERWAADIVGIKIGFNVKHNEWQGSQRAAVKFFPYQEGVE